MPPKKGPKTGAKTPSIKEKLLHAACAYNQTDGGAPEYQALLDVLSNNNCRDLVSSARDGDTIANVFVCVNRRNHREIVQLLMENGVNINVKNGYGFSILVWASAHNKEETVRMLLDHHADVDACNEERSTSLILACDYGNFQIVKWLLKANANMDCQNIYGETALMVAAEKGYTEIVSLLLNRGASIDLKNNRGETVLETTVIEEIKELLQNHVSSSYVLK